MSYKKTVIRQYFVEMLKLAVPSVGGRVYSGRIDPRTKEDAYPFLWVSSRPESVVNQFTTHTERELDLTIVAVVKSNQTADADFDEIVEDLMLEVETAMSRIITVQTYSLNDPFVLVDDITFVKSDINDDNQSSSDICSGMMAYKINYAYNLPVVPLTLENFDVAGTIGHIQITNKGIPLND